LKKPDDFFIAQAGKQEIRARNILLATGVIDEKPSFHGLPESIYNGLIRFCPICDGFEAINKHIGVIGPLSTALPKALFLRTYTPHITLFITNADIDLDDKLQADLRAANLGFSSNLAVGVTPGDDCITVRTDDGKKTTVDILYPAMGAQVRTQLAMSLGAKADEKGYLVTDSRQCTSIHGLYAAGDITLDISQIAVATGQAAIAATAIHNNLPKIYATAVSQ
jgi:thioredoxin reductase (NADPH)